VSASRAFRSQAGRWQWRKLGVEPSAETRAWVARMLGAHDDDNVSTEEFLELAQQFLAFISERPEHERVEASHLMLDRSLEDLLGKPGRSIGMGRWPA
jgi:hypothetical protein